VLYPVLVFELSRYLIDATTEKVIAGGEHLHDFQ
jgi:hypothetical protein